MRKTLSFILAVVFVLSACVVGAGAATYKDGDRPDLVITKICPDNGGIDSKWKNASAANSDYNDPFEAFEIVNTSGKDLNLYEYGITYQGSPHATTAMYEKIVWEFTPFKAGDYRDGGDTSVFTWANTPKNPDTAVLKAGQVIVVWAIWGFVKDDNISIKDFREFWGISDDTLVIAWDGNWNAKDGGADKNFNIKNSTVASYGIARIGSVIEEKTTYDELSTWSEVDFNIELKDVAVKDSNSLVCYTYNSARKMKVSEYAAKDKVKLGVLTEAQKTSLKAFLPVEAAVTTTTAAPTTTTTKAAATTATTKAAATTATTTKAAATTTKAATEAPKTADMTYICAMAALVLVSAAALTLGRKKTGRTK